MTELKCIVCCESIIPERLRKKAVTCSDECQAIYRRFKRNIRAQSKCRLCGRKFRNKSQVSPGLSTLALEPVLMEHDGFKQD